MGKPTRQQWKDLADWYEDTPDQSWNRYTNDAYKALCAEIEERFCDYSNAGMQFIPFSGTSQPYATSGDLFIDIAFGKLYFFMSGDMRDSHLLSRPSGVYGLTYNHLFRCVHDMDHFNCQSGFDAQGELKTFRHAYPGYSNEAAPAYASETIAQTAWVNFGRYLRRPDGTLPKKGEADYVPLHKRPYEDQKMLVIPDPLLSPFVA